MEPDTRYRVVTLNGPSQGSDPLGGDVGPEHALFSTLTSYVSGEPLDRLGVGEAQVRESFTADGILPRRGGQSKAERIRYSVKRVS